ncbi:translation initiation factor [Candidatus Nanohalococcus occultus]|uniref:translation initiation factor n=1 Tax=Candidatus Nanohalococcus occultus TaxID=2978047 RepID=UPI0039E1A55E
MSVCPDCGMEKELCVCDSMAKAEQTITVKIDTRSYNKEMTVVEGFDNEVNLDTLSSKLKSKLACGGTSKDGHIELQGNHTHRIKDVLVKEGFERSAINVK